MVEDLVRIGSSTLQGLGLKAGLNGLSVYHKTSSLGRSISKFNSFGGVCHGTSLKVSGLGTCAKERKGKGMHGFSANKERPGQYGLFPPTLILSQAHPKNQKTINWTVYLSKEMCASYLSLCLSTSIYTDANCIYIYIDIYIYI